MHDNLRRSTFWSINWNAFRRGFARCLAALNDGDIESSSAKCTINRSKHYLIYHSKLWARVSSARAPDAVNRFIASGRVCLTLPRISIVDKFIDKTPFHSHPAHPRQSLRLSNDYWSTRSTFNWQSISALNDDICLDSFVSKSFIFPFFRFRNDKSSTD